MNRFLLISASAHVVLLLILPFVPGLFEDEEMGIDVYSVQLVDIQSQPPRVETPEPEVEEPVDTPPEPVEEVVKERIPEEPAPVQRRVTARREDVEERESLADRLAARLRSQDEQREDEPEVEPQQAEPVTAASATVTANRFPYAWYLSIIQGKVSSNWKQPSSRLITQDRLSTQVSFRIGRIGSADLVTIRRSSGLPNVDQSAVKAVRSATPFPPLPDDYQEDHLDVTIDFTVKQE